MLIYSAKLEWDEDGLHLLIDTDELDQMSRRQMEGKWNFRVSDPEAFYDTVKAGILPWLMECDEARRTLPVAYIDASGAYDLTDPKHPDHHSVMADLWDSREGK